ncbi:DUF4123 domain-containing protein [Variovorax boronicumulans]|uniref:DUF4123 domain-containing protein n=1 Tax=Variovorax boronicumulans TaxID=436515 RepID=UPI001587DB9A|nr:DUF4123 domain-containing protein [Variovorax boronicumulans]
MQSHFSPLAEELTRSWQAMADVECSDLPPVKAYLLLNRWTDNALAEAVAEEFPCIAKDRVAVPDAYYKYEEDRAPCVLPFPEISAFREMHNQFVQWIDFAWRQVEKRQSKQDFCAVILSRTNGESITRHWVDLGHQQPPGGGAMRLMRYQDPRVMQGVWPLLTAAQKAAWLGPVIQWWSLVQPSGPWQSTSTDSARWFCASAPKFDCPKVPAYLNALFDQTQWHAAHLSPSANLVWAGYAQGGVPVEDQPDGAVVSRLLADGQRLGLKPPNLIDYVWSSWLHDAPSGTSRLTAWQVPPASTNLARVLNALRQQPDARFASLYLEALKQNR